jgi:hypothetical protein
MPTRSLGLGLLVERREATQIFDGARQDLKDVINIFLCVVLTEAEANRAARQLVVAAKRANHGRGLKRARRTGRACGDGDALHVKINQQALTLYEAKRDVREMRESPRAMTVEDYVFDTLGDACFKVVA